MLWVTLAFWGCVFIFSTIPLAIKWSIDGIGFVQGAFYRMLIGAIFSFGILKYLKIPIPRDKQAIRTYFASALSIYGAMIFVYWGAQFIPSGLIAVIFGCAPFLTTFFGFYILKENSITLQKVIALLLAIGGLSIIFLSSLELQEHFWKGLLACLFSVFCWVMSSIEIKRIGAQIHPLALTFGGLVTSLPMYFMTMLIFGASPPTSVALRTVYAIAYLGICGSVLGFFFYYFALKNMAASKLSMITLITPVIGILLGIIFNEETLLSSFWWGAAFIVIGLTLHRV